MQKIYNFFVYLLIIVLPFFLLGCNIGSAWNMGM